ncbi:MAG: RagB/SusD family nutrient uptake outer membrane protein [Cyclobacteriaceae bacterium]
MKRYNLIFLFACIFCTASCENDFLNEEPYDFLAPENFYETEEDAFAALNAAYSVFLPSGYYNIFFWMVMDGSTDQLSVGTNKDWEFDINLHTFESISRGIVIVYDGLMTALNPINAVIEFVPEIDMDPATRNRIVAEAKFLRALNYYHLAGAWGGVPLVLKTTKNLNKETLNVPKSTQEEIFDQVIRDLKDAQEVLPISYPSSDYGRVTKGAALALEAKVYLYQKKFDLAAQKAKEVMDLGVYNLLPDYAELWRVDNKNHNEEIFSIQRDCQVQVNFGGTFFSRRVFHYAPNGSGIIPGGEDGDWKAAPEFYNNFPDDYRKEVTFLTEWTYPNGTTRTFEPTCWKYYDPNMCGRNLASNNDPVLRYADVLLIYAESLNETNGPTAESYEAINRVRQRARGVGTIHEKPENVLPDLANLSQEEFREAVWQERNLELCFESHRRYDLIRTGQFEEEISNYLGRNVEPHKILFPISQTALDANPLLEQNPGY